MTACTTYIAQDGTLLQVHDESNNMKRRRIERIRRFVCPHTTKVQGLNRKRKGAAFEACDDSGSRTWKPTGRRPREALRTGHHTPRLYLRSRWSPAFMRHVLDEELDCFKVRQNTPSTLCENKSCIDNLGANPR